MGVIVHTIYTTHDSVYLLGGLLHYVLNIMRLLEGRSADARWHLSGAHKPERQNFVGDESMGCTGVGGAGQNGPGPPNAAKLCNYA